MAQPRLGTVVDGPTTTASITFAGVHERSAYPIHIQVRVGQDWVTLASTVTGELPSSTDATMFEWQVAAAPAQLIPSRWPQGGLVRVRAIGDAGEVLAGLFHDSDACLEETEGWRDRAYYCGDTFASGLVLVSPANVASSPARPRFLDRRGWVDTAETATYYQTINAPATLTEFRTRFSIDTTSPPTVYYNAADLGIGREMRCQPQADGGLACAVSNYGKFGGDQREALDGAVAGTGAFAAVAMVYQPPLDAPNSVQFMVYGAGGALAMEAQLDSVGDNMAVPNNCLNCHGSHATYDATTHQVAGATFLPFDPTTFVFSARAGYTEREQAPSVASLNELIRPATTPSARELIAGWYPQGPSEPVPQGFIPAGWTSTPLERKVYEHVIAASCRNCHVSRTDELSYATAAQFTANAEAIARSVCINRDMPNAEIPLQHLWSGPARAYLAAYLDFTTCNP